MSDAQSREHCETADGVVCNGKGEQIVIVLFFFPKPGYDSPALALF